MDLLSRAKPMQVPETIVAKFATSESMMKNIIETMNVSYDNMDNEAKADFVRSTYSGLLKEVFQNLNGQALSIILEFKYISMLGHVLLNKQLDTMERMYINKLCYDYIKNRDTNKLIKDQLLGITKIINRSAAPKISAILPEDLTNLLIVARYSSDNNMKGASRVNKLLMMQDPEFMAQGSSDEPEMFIVQKMVDIYTALFDRVTPLFEAVMFEPKPINMDQKRATMFGCISLAILYILESMPSEYIRQVLVSYHHEYKLMYSNKPVRFSMSCISADFVRINNVLQLIGESEQVYLP